MKNRSGFTIVEVTVVVIVIAILLTVAAFGVIRYQKDGRDVRRESDATIIAEALEKYYDKNGQYPPCSTFGNPVPIQTAVDKIFPGTDPTAFTSPDHPDGTNSIGCGSGMAYMMYGYEEADCAAGGGPCQSFTLRYTKEADDSVKEIKSRRVAGSVAVSLLAPVLTGSPQLYATRTDWSSISQATQYTLQRSSSSTFATVTTENYTTTTALQTGLTGNTTLYYRVRAVAGSAVSPWSNTVTLKTLAIGTTTLTSTAQSNNTQVNNSWPAIANVTGYRIQRSTSSTFTNGTEVSNDTTALTFNATGLNQGERYYFRVAGLYNGTLGTWSNIPSVLLGINTPPAPSLSYSIATGSSSSTMTLSWGPSGSCPTGTTMNYRSMYSRDGDSWGTGWVERGTGTSTAQAINDGFMNYGLAAAQCRKASTGVVSAWSANSNQVSWLEPVRPPTGINWTFSKSGARIVYITPNGTCRSSVTFYGNMVEWSGSRQWFSPSPRAGYTGWWVDPGDRVVNQYWPSGGVQESFMDIQSGWQYAGKGSFACKNSTTGRESSRVFNQSAMWYW